MTNAMWIEYRRTSVNIAATQGKSTHFWRRARITVCPSRCDNCCYKYTNYQLILWSLNQLKGSHSFLCTYLMYLSDPILYLMLPFHAMVNYQIVLWIYGYKQAFLLACSFYQKEMYNLKINDSFLS